jgi:ferredoxin
MADDTQKSSAQNTSAQAAPQEKMSGKYKVTVVRDKCIGAASCVAIAPKVFKLDDQQKVTIISQDELDDMKLLAAQSCPTQAIVITNIETGEQVWPK